MKSVKSVEQWAREAHAIASRTEERVDRLLRWTANKNVTLALVMAWTAFVFWVGLKL